MMIVVMMMMFVVMMVLVSFDYRDHKAGGVAGRLLAVQQGLFGGGQGLFSGFGSQPLTVAVLKRVLVTRQRLRLLWEVVHVLTPVALVGLSSSTHQRLVAARSSGRPFGRFDELRSTYTGVQRNTVIRDDLRPATMDVGFGLVGPGAILGLCSS